MIKLIVSIDDSQELGTKIHHIMKSEKITEKKFSKIRIPSMVLG